MAKHVAGLLGGSCCIVDSTQSVDIGRCFVLTEDTFKVKATEKSVLTC